MIFLNNIIRIFKCLCEPLISFFCKTSCFLKKSKNFIFYFCGGYPYMCDICDKRFKSKSILSYHLKQNHHEIFSFGSSYEINKKIYKKIMN